MSDGPRRTDLDPTDMIVVLVGSHDLEMMTALNSQPGVVIYEAERERDADGSSIDLSVLDELMVAASGFQLMNLRDDPLDRMERLAAECEMEISALGKSTEVQDFRYFRQDDGTPRSPKQTRRAQRRSRGKRR